MKRFAVVEYGVVQNIIVADSSTTAEEITGKTVVFAENAEIGDLYDYASEIFFSPLNSHVVIESELVETQQNDTPIPDVVEDTPAQ